MTNFVGMQWGTTSAQIIDAAASQSDEHNNMHAGFTAQVNGQENAIGAAFANMIGALKSTPDPLAPGKSMLDTTLVAWTRDVGNGPDHTQAKVPYVLAGATDYLKHGGAGGTYYDLSGQGTTLNVLLNIIESLGAPIGNFATGGTSAQTQRPLVAIKA